MLPNTSFSDFIVPDRNLKAVTAAFDADTLADICVLPEDEFGDAYTMDKWIIEGEKAPDNFFFHRDNGSNVLAVAHLDTVAGSTKRAARFVETEGGIVVHSRALDDRLGAYIILDMLPKLGLDCDVLLTVGEETGNSTAQYYQPDKQYDWMIEFDRGGTDVVMYQYDDDEVQDLVKEAGARVGEGIFSDICYLEQLGVKGFNWGVGYQDYHGPRAHAYLDDTLSMVSKYVTFHQYNEGTFMPHYPTPSLRWWDDADDEAVETYEAEVWDDVDKRYPPMNDE